MSGDGASRLCSIGVVIVAGGAARRLPGKLGLAFDGLPLIAGACRRLAGAAEMLVAVRATPAPDVDAVIPAPLVVDRWRDGGPLAGLLSTLPLLRSRLVFAAAADAPLLDAAFVERLLAAWDARTLAVVPVHGQDRLEPLAAVYDRAAFLAAGWALWRNGGRSLREVAAALQARRLRFEDERPFANVNTAADYAALVRERR